MLLTVPVSHSVAEHSRVLGDDGRYLNRLSDNVEFMNLTAGAARCTLTYL